MKPNKNAASTFEDVKINVKIKLSALWIAVMFLYVYADFKALLQPGLIELIIAGELLISIKITQELLFGAAINQNQFGGLL